MAELNKNIPLHWGDDSLSKFIEMAQHNTFATFANFPHQYKILNNIHDVYISVIDNLPKSQDFFAYFFILKAHSAYLGGVRFAISGQCAEAYMVLRGCLESAIYGLYLSRNKGSQEVWLNRHENEESLKRVKNEFKMFNLFNELESVDPAIHKTTRLLYERTIDYGAHPNELALTSLLRKTEEEDKIKFDLDYLTDNTPAFQLVMETTAQVGLCALYIFKNIYKERFDILGISEKLDRFRRIIKKA
jgi:hypothetical protein